MADRKTLRKRERNAADVLMNNPALRENLEDVQAELMLNWSFDQIGFLVKETAELSDTAAEAQIDKLVDKLQDNLKQLSSLTGNMPGCNDQLAATRDYQRFLKTVYGSQKKVPEYAQEMMVTFVKDTQTCTAEETFSHFFAIIQKEVGSAPA